LAVKELPAEGCCQPMAEDVQSQRETQPAGKYSQQKVEELVDRLERGVKSARLVAQGARQSELAFKLAESERREWKLRTELEEINHKIEVAERVNSCFVTKLVEQLAEKDEQLAELQGARDNACQHAEGLAEDLKTAYCEHLHLVDELEEHAIMIGTTNKQNETLRAEYRMGLVDQEVHPVCYNHASLLTPEQTPDDAAMEANLQIQQRDDHIRELQLQLEKAQAKERASPRMAYQQNLEARSKAQQQELSDRREERMRLLEFELQAANSTREVSNNSRTKKNMVDLDASTEPESVKPNNEHNMQLQAQLDAANAHIKSLENDVSLSRSNQEQTAADLQTSQDFNQRLQARLGQVQLEAEEARGARQDQHEHIRELELELHSIKGKLADQHAPASQLETDLQITNGACCEKQEQSLPCDSQLTDGETQHLLRVIEDLKVRESALKQNVEDSKEELHKELQLESCQKLDLLRASKVEELANAANMKAELEWSSDPQPAKSRSEQLASPSIQDLPTRIRDLKQDSSLEMSMDEAARVRRMVEDNFYLTNQLKALWREMSAKAAGQVQPQVRITPPMPRPSTPRAPPTRGSTPRASTPRASTPRASTPRTSTPRTSPALLLNVARCMKVAQNPTASIFQVRAEGFPQKASTPRNASPKVTPRSTIPLMHRANRPDQSVHVGEFCRADLSSFLLPPSRSSWPSRAPSTLCNATNDAWCSQDQVSSSRTQMCASPSSPPGEQCQLLTGKQMVVVQPPRTAMQVMTEHLCKVTSEAMPIPISLRQRATMMSDASLTPRTPIGANNHRSLSKTRSARASPLQPQGENAISGSQWISPRGLTPSAAASPLVSPRAQGVSDNQPAHFGTRAP